MNNQTAAAVEVQFEQFADLSAEPEDSTASLGFMCLGHRWYLEVFPRGQSRSPDGMVAIFLKNVELESDESIEIEFTLTVEKSCAIEEEATRVVASTKFKSHTFLPGGNWGTYLFAERSVLLGAIRQGALVIKVEMTQPEPSSESSQHFVPGNPLVKNIMKMFNHEESADVVFDVSCWGAEDKSKEPTKFYAHRLILENGAPTLFDLMGSGDGSLTRIPITDVEPIIFKGLLSYVYGGNVESGDLKDSAKTYIDAADKYNIVNLKLEAEASLVSTTAFTVENVLEFLLYADEKNCALLKEKAMDFLVKNRIEAHKQLSFVSVPSYLMGDMLAAFEMKEDMRVGALRKKLHEKGLDVDGSREAMIARLDQHS